MRKMMQPDPSGVTMTKVMRVMNAFRRERRMRAHVGEADRALNEVVFAHGPRSLAAAVAGCRPIVPAAGRPQYGVLTMPPAALRLAAAA